MIETTVPRKKWWKIQWYSDDDTPEERAFIIKLDLLVVPYAILAYWVKYIDQANLSTYAFPLDAGYSL
jgi:MFS transporter, ACS family, DAL5 transporter family protein